ncbi:DUF427 domain-containing protein [Actinopolymorpha sp. B17G11]|uniref:DUF427 domain-containing protein n=1 Tax=unclassified Actinopolymorpha TaxID=2627063 RepID=UPI0032D9A100
MSTTQERPRVETGAKRVRAYFGGEVVADTVEPVLVWEIPYYPAYYLPAKDVRTDLLTPGGEGHHSERLGDGTSYTLRVGAKEATGAALRYLDSPVEELRDLVRLDWDAMDAWFEEDEEVFVHPRSPYARIDVLASSRHVRVEVDGVTVAESAHPTLLFETGLPVRYYLPKTHVRMDLLTPSATATHCPYKGQAEYWSVTVNGTEHPDLAWSYRTPLPESQKVAGLIAFYDDKVDVYVDGVLQKRR